MAAFNKLAELGVEATKADLESYQAIENMVKTNNVKTRTILNELKKQKEILKY